MCHKMCHDHNIFLDTKKVCQECQITFVFDWFKKSLLHTTCIVVTLQQSNHSGTFVMYDTIGKDVREAVFAHHK